MELKPSTAAGYDRAFVRRVRQTCLYLATRLNDLLDHVIVVGGLAPSLLVDQVDAREEHVGTLDLDIGLELAVLNDKRYQELTARLRQAGFGPDVNERGNPTRQRWKIEGKPRVTVDFLIPATEANDLGGSLRDLEEDFA